MNDEKKMVEMLKVNLAQFGVMPRDMMQLIRENDRMFLSPDGEWIEEPESIPPHMLTVYRLHTDFQLPEEKKRWFFSIRGTAIEVQESDLPYLKKPEGDWEFRRALIGDLMIGYLETGADPENAGIYFAISCGHVDSKLNGYRWCKPPVAKVRFDDIPITRCGVIYRCQVTGYGEYRLHELPSIAGFGGVQFKGQSAKNHWSMSVTSFIGSNGGLSGRSDKGVVAVPVCARFWIKS